MIEHHCGDFYERLKVLTIGCSCYTFITEVDSNGNLPVEADQKKHILEDLLAFTKAIVFFEMPDVIQHIVRRCAFIHQCDHLTVAMVYSELESISDLVSDKLRQRKFTYIPQDRATYFERDQLFGEAVRDLFPRARVDIKDAGNRFAAELPVSAVFHRMRVVENGIRATARYCRVRIAPGVKDTKQWGDHIGDIERALKITIPNPPRKTKQRKDAEDMCHKLLQEMRTFKDAWRNPVMHDRDNITAEDAIAVFGHVSTFMRLLAVNGITETSRKRLPKY